MVSRSLIQRVNKMIIITVLGTSLLLQLEYIPFEYLDAIERIRIYAKGILKKHHFFMSIQKEKNEGVNSPFSIFG